MVTSRETNDLVVMNAGSSGPVNYTALRFVHLLNEVQQSLSAFILGGVLERFPGLNIVSAESDVGWFAHYMHRLDHAREKFGAMVQQPLSMKPSDYTRRQVWATFQDDPVGPGQLSLLWRGELYVDLGFSAYRHHLAQLTPGHCPGLCRRAGPHHPQDRV